MIQTVLIYLLHAALFLSMLIFGKRLYPIVNSFVEKIGSKTLLHICTILLITVLLYYLPSKWILGWHTDPWLIEALFLLVTFALCDMYIIIYGNHNPANTYDAIGFLRYIKKPYFLIRTMVVAIFTGKLALSFILALIPYGGTAYLSILPEVRYQDYHMSDNYYIDYTTVEKLLITRKFGCFEKDIEEFGCPGIHDDIRYPYLKSIDSLEVYNYEIFPKACFVTRGDTTFFTTKFLAKEAKEKCFNCNWGVCKYCIDNSSRFRKQSISFHKDEHILTIRCNTMDHGAASITVSGRPTRYVDYELKIDLRNNSHKLITY